MCKEDERKMKLNELGRPFSFFLMAEFLASALPHCAMKTACKVTKGCVLILIIFHVSRSVLTGSPSRGGDVTVYV